MVVQIEDFWKTSAGGQLFGPIARGELVFEQIFDAVLQATAGRVSAGNQAENGPGGLRRGAARRSEGVVVVAGAAFAPAAIGILNGAQPFTGAQHVRFPIALTGRAQAAQGKTGAVNIGHAPAPVP